MQGHFCLEFWSAVDLLSSWFGGFSMNNVNAVKVVLLVRAGGTDEALNVMDGGEWKNQLLAL